MDHLKRAFVSVAAVAVLVAAFAGCDDDSSGADAGAIPTSITPPTTEEPVTGGLDIPEIPGTRAAPLPSLGFGIAFPEGWNATRLDAEALEKLSGVTLDQPGFGDAAHAVAETGAVFYAAGTDEEGRVGELKIDVQDAADTSAEAVRSLAETIAGTEGFVDTTVTDAQPDGRVRVDYRIEASGIDDEGDPIDTFGSQLLVPDGDRLWSIIITSEDRASQDALLRIFAGSFTLADR